MRPHPETLQPYDDRRAAGADLASRLGAYANRDDVVVLALPRGGVPVAFEIATALGVLLDIFLVRKLGVPSQPELAMGAIASGGVRVLNDEVVSWYGIDPQSIDEVARPRANRTRSPRTGVSPGPRPRSAPGDDRDPRR